jgi:Flp pilus assembly protein TadD
VVCFGTAGYYLVHHDDAQRVRDANRSGLQRRYAQAAGAAHAVRGTPEGARARLVEAEALAALGRDAAASRAFGRAAQTDPNNWAIHRDWAVVLARLGRRIRAGSEMGRALALNPRMSVPPGFLPSPR